MHTGMHTVLSRRRFDVDEYHRMLEAGILTEDDRVELLDGEIVQMHSIGSRHGACVAGLTRTFVKALDGRAVIGIQNPVRLSQFSEPEPDVSVLKPRIDLYASETPRAEHVLLLIEVADSSLRLDKTIKLPLYAAADIPELWIVDLVSDVVQVHRAPTKHGYTEIGSHVADTLSPLAFPELQLDVQQILRPTL